MVTPGEEIGIGEAGAPQFNPETQDLQEEVLRLQRKLGEAHGGDLHAVQRAYKTLCQHVEALEAEAEGMVAQLAEFETEVIPPELVAQELSVAAAVAFGAALLHQTIKVLPLSKAAAPVLAKGVWLLGGAFVLARLTGGALAHFTGMFGRNASRKRQLQRKLEVVQDRIAIMVALQQWAEKQPAPSATAAGAVASAAGAGAGGSGSGGSGGGGAGGGDEAGLSRGAGEAGLAVPAPPRRRISPAESSSSAEMVEMPQAEELEAAEEGTARAAAAAVGQAPARASSSGGGVGSRRASEGQAGQGARPGSSGGDPLQSLRAYAELGEKK